MRILLGRGSGHGDVLCLTSALPGLKARYPDAEITFWSEPGYGQVTWGHPLIDVWRESREDPATLVGYDLILTPNHGERWNKPIPIVQCEMLDLPFSPPGLYLTAAEKAAAAPHQLAVWNHTVSERSYDQMSQLVALLRDHDLVQVDNGPNLGIPQPPLSIRQAAAVIARAQLTLGVDTSFMHVAAALEIPQVIIFGPLTGVRNQWIPRALLHETRDAPEKIAATVRSWLDTGARSYGVLWTDSENEVHQEL